MPHYILRLVQLVAFGVLVTRASEINYKVCATKSAEDCKKLQHRIQCDYNPSVRYCSEKIDKENDTFGVINGSDAYAVGRFKENLIVVADFIHEHHSNGQKFQHEFVAFATNGIKHFEDLRGTTLCHPGLYVSNVDTDLLAKFDLKLSDIINKKYHLDLEARLQFLSNFFGPSCIPGKWTSNSTLDDKLKKKYYNLVKLCSNDPNENAFDQSLNCLLNTTKGVALTTLHTVETYKAKNSLSAYKYICPNGTINDEKNSCRWFVQPLNIIVANKNLAESLPTDLKKWFEESSSLKRSVDLDPESTKILKNVTFPSVQYTIHVINQAPSTTKYISGLNAPSPDQCSKTNITWCTTSPDKNDDCKWFSAKNTNFHLDCERQEDCMTSLSEKNTNFVIIPADEAFSMRNKFTPIVGLGNKLNSLIVVNPDVKDFDDLKNQIGCFDKYQGIAWFSFMKVARNTNLKMDAIGELEKPVGTHLNACETNGRGISNCDKKIEGSPLKCLEKPGYYVVTNEAGNSDENYTILCKNGSLIQQTGLNVDEYCYLSIVSSDLVVTSKDEPAIEDIKWIVSQLGFSKVEDADAHVIKLFNRDSDSSTNIAYGCTLLLIIAVPVFFNFYFS